MVHVIRSPGKRIHSPLLRVDPFIYHTLFITGSTKSKQIEYTLSQRDPVLLQGMIKTFIRGIPFGDSEAQLESRLLPALSCITHMSYFCTSKSFPTLTRLLLECHALRRITISFPSRQAAERHLPSLCSEHVTHLSLRISGFSLITLYSQDTWEGLSRRFRRLQCLYLHGYETQEATPESCKKILRAFEPQLRRLILDVSARSARSDSPVERSVLPKEVFVISANHGCVVNGRVLRGRGVSYPVRRNGDWLTEKILELDFWDAVVDQTG